MFSIFFIALLFFNSCISAFFELSISLFKLRLNDTPAKHGIIDCQYNGFFRSCGISLFVFINGKFVGNVTYQYPPRWYNVPENLLVEGKNTIAVRIVSNSGKGGFVPDKPYELTIANTIVDLKGVWKMKLGCSMPPTPGTTFFRWKPMGLYNGMIAPLLQYNKKGVIWYQGESNTSQPYEYAKLLPTMITSWLMG
jgi:hypothetical protein